MTSNALSSSETTNSHHDASLRSVDDEAAVSTTAHAIASQISDPNNTITVIVMDSAHSKFPILAHPTWTIEQFKERGALIHKVPPAAQRLVFRGKMWTNNKETLQDNGIVANDTIVHLFPRPTILVAGSSHDVRIDNQQQENNGAHVPCIVLDPRRPVQSSSTTSAVVSNEEELEAQRCIKYLCLVLISMTLVELLRLVSASRLVVVVESSAKDTPPQSNELDQDYFRWIVDAFGFYIAMLILIATRSGHIDPY